MVKFTSLSLYYTSTNYNLFISFSTIWTSIEATPFFKQQLSSFIIHQYIFRHYLYNLSLSVLSTHVVSQHPNILIHTPSLYDHHIHWLSQYNLRFHPRHLFHSRKFLNEFYDVNAIISSHITYTQPRFIKLS